MSSSQPMPTIVKWMIFFLFLGIAIIGTSLFYVSKVEKPNEVKKEITISPQEIHYANSMVQN